jgi:thiamine-phosphate diphosphorylase
MFSFPNKLYPITDTRLAMASHVDQVEQLCKGGARFIQLREKQLPPREFLREAEAALAIARRAGAKLVINDRADIALALHADGVHIGQDDIPPEAARKLLGPEAIVGYSTHNLAEARLAAQLPVSYIAIGPIFSTATKANPEPVVGLDGLRRAREVVGEIPLVAIGGIKINQVAGVIAAGADAVAVISALFEPARSISNNTAKFLQSLANA